MRFFTLLLATLLVLIAACNSAVPDPVVTVVITAVDDTTALADGVAEALTGTALNPIGLTETRLAQLGYTLTPTRTPTATASPIAPTATSPLTPTPTVTASNTPTATYIPLPTNAVSAPEVSSEGNQPAGRLRILNAWVSDSAPDDVRVDVYVNDVRMARALDLRQATAYQQVAAGTVRVDLRSVLFPEEPPLLGLTVTVPAGGSISLVMADLGSGLTLIPIAEDISPLPSGVSRLTVLQANPTLLESNVFFPQIQRELTQNLQIGQILGPFDIERDNYRLEFYDSFSPDILVGEVAGLNLAGQVNHLLVLIPTPPEVVSFTDYILFTGSTRLVDTDVSVRFVNAASEIGTVAVGWDNLTQLSNLQVGDMSVPVPVSALGTTLIVTDENGNEVGEGAIGTSPDLDGDKIVVMLNAQSSTNQPVTDLAVFTQNPSPSAIRASLRLINALPDTVPLSLQTSVVHTSVEAPTPSPWEVVVANVSYGQPSQYSGRAPDLYEIRVVLTGTETAIAVLGQVQLLAGGTYDFVVVPGSEPGSAELLLIQPDVQPGLAASQDPEIVKLQVDATLTAMVTPDADTPTPIRTPTATITPIPTNTAHPTNTPSVLPPQLIIEPAPPNTAIGSFTILGLNFKPEARYTISLDDGPVIRNGTVDENGTLLVTIPLANSLSPGPHIVGICVDCRAGGTPQAIYAVVIVANPNITPTPTRQA